LALGQVKNYMSRWWPRGCALYLWISRLLQNLTIY